MATQAHDPLRLDLAPEDYFWATWRNTPPLPRPETPPFDKTEALRRLQKVGKDVYSWSWNWHKAAIPTNPSREEAHFWILALRPVPQTERVSPQQLAEQLASETFHGDLSFAQAVELLKLAEYYTRPLAARLLAAFGSTEDLVNLILGQQDFNGHRYQGSGAMVLIEGFQRFILPFLPLEERQRLSTMLTPHLAHIPEPQNISNHYLPAVYLAAIFGGHDKVLHSLIESWPDDRYTKEQWHDHYQLPQKIVFGLADPQLVDKHMRRLKLRLHTPEYIRAWLAHSEFAALDYPRDSVLAAENKDDAAALTEVLGLAIGPQTAPHMLELLHTSRAPQIAREWLENHPGHAIEGLLPVASGRSKWSDAAAELLRRFVRRGYAEALTAALTALDGEAAARLQASVLDAAVDTRPPFAEATATEHLRTAFDQERRAKAAKLPAWLRPADLPPLALSGHILADEHRSLALQTLKRSTLDEPTALASALREEAELPSREAFAWALFEQWLVEGAPSKENWAMLALGLFGGDATALRLAPLVRAWPGESQHQRAVVGLECLRTIGSDTALMQINGIAQKVKFKALQARAGECMERIAAARGLSRAELEDRIVPDCDLDARGERVFDFGPRKFRFALGPDLKPLVRDTEGKLKSDLPKPGAKDDAPKANEAVAAWKLLKKQVAEVARVQALRLEQAMVVGRRWPRADFELLLVRHPLMTHLVRPLIWGAYDWAGTLAATFRVTEDQSYATNTDEGFDLTPFATVALVHPLHLPQAEQNQWGEVLGDYELVPPFPQLGRPIYQLEAGEQGAREITRFNTLRIPAASLVFGLDKQGWQRDAPADGGGFHGHFKPFYQANLTAVVQYEEGVAVGYIVDAPDQHLEYLAFVPGIREAEYWPAHKDRLPLSEVDPVVISEALNDVITVMAKAK
jgi:hypothetical protein